MQIFHACVYCITKEIPFDFELLFIAYSAAEYSSTMDAYSQISARNQHSDADDVQRCINTDMIQLTVRTMDELWYDLGGTSAVGSVCVTNVSAAGRSVP